MLCSPTRTFTVGAFQIHILGVCGELRWARLRTEAMLQERSYLAIPLHA